MSAVLPGINSRTNPKILPRILVAGLGNLFKGDDAFGVEVARRLESHAWSQDATIEVRDFGIRSFDLGHALLDEDYARVILVDAIQRGHAPGTISLIEPDPNDPGREDGALAEAHGMHPARVLQWVMAVGGKLPPLRLVGCEPEMLCAEDELLMGLSDTVEKAIPAALELIEEVIDEAVAEFFGNAGAAAFGKESPHA